MIRRLPRRRIRPPRLCLCVSAWNQYRRVRPPRYWTLAWPAFAAALMGLAVLCCGGAAKLKAVSTFS